MSDCPVCTGIPGYEFHTCGKVGAADDKPLPIFRTKADERIAELESHNLGLANESCALQERVAALESRLKTAVGGLTAITNPVKHMRDELSEGEQLNGRMALQISKDPEYLKDIAAKTLMKIYGGEG